jgi:hypothetical protein
VSQLPEAFSVALSVLQEAAGAVLIPWLATQPVLDADTCEVCSSCHEPHFRQGCSGMRSVVGAATAICMDSLSCCRASWDQHGTLVKHKTVDILRLLRCAVLCCVTHRHSGVPWTLNPGSWAPSGQQLQAAADMPAQPGCLVSPATVATRALISCSCLYASTVCDCVQCLGQSLSAALSLDTVLSQFGVCLPSQAVWWVLQQLGAGHLSTVCDCMRCLEQCCAVPG